MFFCANESDYITFPLKTPQQLSILLGKRQNPFVCVRLSLSAGSPAPPAPPPRLPLLQTLQQCCSFPPWGLSLLFA